MFMFSISTLLLEYLRNYYVISFLIEFDVNDNKLNMSMHICDFLVTIY
jgi:hypothetical protein